MDNDPYSDDYLSSLAADSDAPNDAFWADWLNTPDPAINPEDYLNSVSPDNPYDETPYEFTESDLAGMSPSMLNQILGGLSSAARALVTNSNGQVDLSRLAGLLGAGYGYSANRANAVDLSNVGTNAVIPELTAARAQVPYQYDAYRTPGSGGRRYFTDVRYADRNNAAAQEAALQATAAQAAGLAALQNQLGAVSGTLRNPTSATSYGTVNPNSGYTVGGGATPAPPPPSATSTTPTTRPPATTTPTTASAPPPYSLGGASFGAGSTAASAVGPMSPFEAAYLKANPDVAEAVASGLYASGYEHYVLYGAGEGRPTGGIAPPSADEQALARAQIGSRGSYGNSTAALNYLTNLAQAQAQPATPNSNLQSAIGSVRAPSTANMSVAQAAAAAGAGAGAAPVASFGPGYSATDAYLQSAMGQATAGRTPVSDMSVAQAAAAAGAGAPSAPAYSQDVANLLHALLPGRQLDAGDYAYWTNNGGVQAVQNTFGAPTAAPVPTAVFGAPVPVPVAAPAPTAQPYQGYTDGYAAGGYLDGDTNGQADELHAMIEGEEPAKLSHGEFIIPADIVAALGGGNSNAGAQELYDMMDRIREHAYGHTEQMRPVDPGKTLPV